MKNNKFVYEKLSEKFSDEEIAESYVFPAESTPEQDEEFRKLRMKMLDEMTPQDFLNAEAIRLSFLNKNNNERI